jgi:hypothetical protein
MALNPLLKKCCGHVSGKMPSVRITIMSMSSVVQCKNRILIFIANIFNLRGPEVVISIIIAQ